ncbi:MAG TPA: VOC family protein [Acidimicrobiales bacterium]|nr:VOC family protein [Acidimicrobiales bacterium]
MRDSADVFHLAIPARDLDEAQRFYVGGLGCHLARRYDDRITLDFFGDQVVCHLSDAYDRDPQMYPRHFGVTFRRREDFDAALFCAQTRDLTFFRGCEPRFKDTVEEHLTFVLRDPSGNLIEFKHYRDPRMMY